MDYLQLVLIALSLAMDAFAVSICQGLKIDKITFKRALIIGLFFGVFQALMPLVGYFLGSAFATVIQSIDHWVAFGLLALIGGKMLYDGIKNEDEGQIAINSEGNIDLKTLVIMAIATSIDALAVGVTFSFGDSIIWIDIAVIGVITLVLSTIGVYIGKKCGDKFHGGAEIIGGIILILIGLKILLEHLGVIAF